MTIQERNDATKLSEEGRRISRGELGHMQTRLRNLCDALDMALDEIHRLNDEYVPDDERR